MDVTAELCTSNRDLNEPRCSPDGRWISFTTRWAGRAAICVVPAAGGPEQLVTVGPDPRPGRGGGSYAWTPDGSAIVYAAADGRVLRQPFPGGDVVAVGIDGPGLGADRPATAPVVSAGGWIAFVVGDLAELWVVSPDGAAMQVPGTGDFVVDPAWAPDGSLRWHEWSVPAMAWDDSRIGRWSPNTPDDPPTFLDTPGRQAQQPFVDLLGREWSLRDDDGWLRVWCDERCAAEEPFEHGGPTWGPGQRSYAVSADGTQLAWCRDEHGFGRLVVAPIDETGVADLAQARTLGRGVHGQLSWAGATLVALRSGATTPPQLVAYDATTGERTVLVRAGATGWDAARLVEPSLVSWSSGDGGRTVIVPGRRYDPPDGPTGRTIWWLHGGPTDHWPVSFLPRVAFWVDRGWTVVVPDFRGSTGHGRDHQQALNEGWGVVDTTDVLSGVRSLHATGVSDPARTVVMGSSAGGFTALHAVAAAPESFAAAVVSYPVGDLELLDQTTHRFEAHYNRVLVGDPVVDADRYAERSPARFPERFTRPLLVLHGDADPVVGLEQSRLLVEGIRRGGGDAELVEYEGEGHGFRQRANQLDEYARVVEFLGRHVP